MNRKIVAGTIGALATCMLLVGWASAGASQPRHLITLSLDTGMSPDTRSEVAPGLAHRSLSVPGVRQALLVRVDAVRGSTAISTAPDGSPQRIVTDYSISVLHRWSRHPESIPDTLRVPGGAVGDTVEEVQGLPAISIGGLYLVWDQSQPSGSPAGGSAAEIVVVPSEGNIAPVDAQQNVRWVGKVAPLFAMESALDQGER